MNNPAPILESLSTGEVPTCSLHWPSEASVPASSWPALSACAHRSSGPSCSLLEWWGHWDRSASPRASTSQGCFLSRERRKKKKKRRRVEILETEREREEEEEGDYKEGQAVQSHSAEHFSWWIALQTARGKDVFSCSNQTSHQVH